MGDFADFLEKLKWPSFAFAIINLGAICVCFILSDQEYIIDNRGGYGPQVAQTPPTLELPGRFQIFILRPDWSAEQV